MPNFQILKAEFHFVHYSPIFIRAMSLPLLFSYEPSAMSLSLLFSHEPSAISYELSFLFSHELRAFFSNFRQRLSLTLLMTAVIIIKTDDIVLFKIFAVLDLDDLERNLAEVLKPVLRGHGDIGALVRVHVIRLIPIRYPRSPCDHDPVFTPVMMELMRKLGARFYLNTLYLVPFSCLQHGIGAPGAVHRGVDQMLIGLAFFELIDHFFD